MATGKVTLDGQPLQEGTIAFDPTDGATATAGGNITNGQYSVPLDSGPKIVRIEATKVISSTKDPASSTGALIEVRESIIPTKYNQQSELKADVKSGENTFDFDLKSK